MEKDKRKVKKNLLAVKPVDVFHAISTGQHGREIAPELTALVNSQAQEITRLTRALADSQTVATLRWDLLRERDAEAEHTRTAWAKDQIAQAREWGAEVKRHREQIEEERAARVAAEARVEKLLSILDNHLDHDTSCALYYSSEAECDCWVRVIVEMMDALRDGGKEKPCKD